jgi:hypothetical protein
MTDALTALDQISEDVAKLAAAVNAARTKSVPSATTQPIARSVARLYFENVRSELEAVQIRTGLVEEIDGALQAILQLASATREKDAYLGQIRELTPYLLEATVGLMKARGASRLVLSQTERAILETLSKMLPAASASYEQALRDILQGARLSWRGTAAELREVLREVLDHLAPDKEVTVAPGFQMEHGQTSPTQKQKVRFILRARRSSRAVVAVAEASLATVDEAVAALVRSTYQRGSASTHVATSGSEIRNLKGYVDALLAELLEVG